MCFISRRSPCLPSSEYGAFAGEVARFRPLDGIIFLVTLNLVCVRHLLTFLHLVAEGHLVYFRADLYHITCTVFAKVYLDRVTYNSLESKGDIIIMIEGLSASFTCKVPKGTSQVSKLLKRYLPSTSLPVRLFSASAS